jgi:hypothetical protein
MRSSKVDDPRRPVAHLEHRRLIGQEIAAQRRLVEVHPLGVTLLPRDVVTRVNPALRADGVRALHRDHREEVDVHAVLGELDGAGEARQTTSDDDDTFLTRSCHFFFPVAWPSRPWLDQTRHGQDAHATDGSPHLFSHLRPLLVNEADVVLEMVDG